jgi:O-antigen/teichoic acid export membrane protein
MHRSISEDEAQFETADPVLSAPSDLGGGIARPEFAPRGPVGTILKGIGGRAALMLVNMLVLLVTSRVMLPAEFGRFAIAQLSVDLLAATSYAFVGIPLLQRHRLRSIDYRNAFSLLLIVGVAAGALLFTSAGVVERLLGMTGLAPLLRAAALIIPVRCVASFFIAVLQRQSKVEQIILSQMKSQIVAGLGVTLVFALLGFGAWSLMLGLAAATTLEFGWCMKAAKIRPHFTLTKASFQLLADGRAPLANRILIFTSDSIDRLAIGATFGASPLGTYTRASNLVLIPTNLIGLPAQAALLSWFSRIKGNKARISEALGDAIAFQGLLLVPIAAALWLASPLLVHVLLGNKWSPAIPIAQILFVGAFARLGTTPFECAALAAGYAWGAARRQLASTAILFVGLIIAVGHSVTWVAIAVAVSRVVYYVLGLRFAVVTFEESWPAVAAAHGKSLVIALVGIGAALALNSAVQFASALANQLVMVTGYLLASGTLLLMGPKWLVAPAGPWAGEFLVRIGRGLLVRRT